MVKIREAHSIGDALPNGVGEWLARIPGLEDPQNYPLLPEALGRVLQAYPVGVDDVRRQARLAACMDILETLHALRLDEEALLRSFSKSRARQLAQVALRMEDSRQVRRFMEGVLAEMGLGGLVGPTGTH